jgi:outer membrane lipoprotein-sorting protein
VHAATSLPPGAGRARSDSPVADRRLSLQRGRPGRRDRHRRTDRDTDALRRHPGGRGDADRDGDADGHGDPDVNASGPRVGRGTRRGIRVPDDVTGDVHGRPDPDDEAGQRDDDVEGELWARLSTGEYRTEVIAPEDRAGNVVVGGTETVWSYSEETNQVTKLDRPDAGSNVSATVVSTLATQYEVTDYEEATVDGRETYRVTLAPETEGSVDATVTAHLDRETYFPVVVEQSYDLENRTFTSRTEYEDVTLNATIPDERFTFEPPENATVETVDVPETESFESLDAMRESVDASVPDPAVPDGYEFTQGNVVHGDNTSLTLRYENDTATLAVSKLESTRSMGDGENVTVGEHDGRVRTFGETTMVVWTCDGWTYSVSGELDREKLLDLAASMECV